MSQLIEVCDGATISAAEVKRVEDAMAQLVKDNGAARTMSVEVILHNHNEYPKMLYKGKETRTVDSKESEAAAVKDGFGSYDHKSFTAPEPAAKANGKGK